MQCLCPDEYAQLRGQWIRYVVFIGKMLNCLTQVQCSEERRRLSFWCIRSPPKRRLTVSNISGKSSCKLKGQHKSSTPLWQTSWTVLWKERFQLKQELRLPDTGESLSLRSQRRLPIPLIRFSLISFAYCDGNKGKSPRQRKLHPGELKACLNDALSCKRVFPDFLIIIFLPVLLSFYPHSFRSHYQTCIFRPLLPLLEQRFSSTRSSVGKMGSRILF